MSTKPESRIIFVLTYIIPFVFISFFSDRSCRSGKSLLQDQCTTKTAKQSSEIVQKNRDKLKSMEIFSPGQRVVRCNSPAVGSPVKDGAQGTVLERLPNEDGAAAYGYMVAFGESGAPPVFCAGSRLARVIDAAVMESADSATR